MALHRLVTAAASLACAAAFSLALSACGGDDDDNPAPASGLTIQTLSNRADLVSGGSVLVEVKMPASAASAATSQLRVSVNGNDQTSAFTTRADGRTVGLVTGLTDGANTVQASAADNSFAGAKLTVTNHPIGGPVLLGSQITPFVCATPSPVAANGNTPASNASGLTTIATDAQCNIATEVKFFYRTTTAGCANVLPDPSPPTPAPVSYTHLTLPTKRIV